MSVSLPDLVVQADEQLYLLLDGGQIPLLERRLFEVADTPAYQPLYLYSPWDSLREISPCLVAASTPLLHWYETESRPNWGYLLTSTLPLIPLAERLRYWLEGQSPYGSQVLLKPAQPESMYRLFQDDDPRFWQDIRQVWLPVRAMQQPNSPFIWWHKQADLSALPMTTELQDNGPLRLSDTQWQRLADVSWLTTLDDIAHHMQSWFPLRLIAQSDPNQWIAKWANCAYAKGFHTTQDLLYFFNILGYLGDQWWDTDEYPALQEYLNTATPQTPSQRIELAAHWAEERALLPEVK